MSTRRKGDYCELLASAWLLDQGYEVFKNVSAVGPIDMVAVDLKNGDYTQIDVTQMTKNTTKSGKVSVSYDYSKDKQGIRVLCVDKDNRDCCWSTELRRYELKLNEDYYAE